MIRTQYEQDVIDALAWLRSGWDGDNSVRAIKAFETLDNAGVFADLDEQTDYTPSVEILAESALKSLNEAAGGPLDPAEWGDTTRLDIATRQGLTPEWGARIARTYRCTCGRANEPSPALHNGTCPVWEQHHHLT